MLQSVFFMLKPTILIGTVLISHLAGVCCAMEMPASDHHAMMHAGTMIHARTVTNVLPPLGDCNSRQMNNDACIERDLGRGCLMSERMKRGGDDAPIDYAPTIINLIDLPISVRRSRSDRCVIHSVSPPRLLEQTSGVQLLF